MAIIEDRSVVRAAWLIRLVGMTILIMILVAGGLVHQALCEIHVQSEAEVARCTGIAADHQKIQSAQVDIQSRLKALQAELAVDEASIPARLNETEILRTIGTHAERIGFRMVDFRPGRVVRAGEFSAREFQITGVGTYRSCCEMLQGLQAYPQAGKLRETQFTPSDDKTDACKVDVVWMLYYREAL